MCLERTTEGWLGVDGTDGGGKTVLYVGPATEKARLPNFCMLVLCKASCGFSATVELLVILTKESPVDMQMSCRCFCVYLL